MKQLWISLLLLGVTTPLFSQKTEIVGQVKSIQEEVLEYYNVELLDLSGNDTVVISGLTSIVPSFELTVPLTPSLFLRVSSLGYKTKLIKLDYASYLPKVNLGVILITPSPLALQEVVVEGNRPTIRMKEGNMIVNIRNTVLSHVGSLSDVLKRTPGIITSGENDFGVRGRGGALILIDDREIKNKSELEVLRSIDIESIEIDRSPSSKYSASIKAIIHIRKKKQITNFISTQVTNTSHFKRHFSDAPTFRLATKTGILSTLAIYQFGHHIDKIYEQAYKKVVNPAYTLGTTTDMTAKSKANKHTVLLGSELNFKKNTIGLRYLYDILNYDADELGDNRITKQDQIINKKIQTINDRERTSHNLSLNYLHRQNENSLLTVIGDYAQINTDVHSFITEDNVDFKNSSTMQITNLNKYKVYTAHANYDLTLPLRFKLEIGANYSYLNNSGNNKTERINNPLPPNEQSKLKDEVVAGYINLNKRWDNWTAYLGLRYEYSKSNIHLFSDGKENKTNRYYSDFFPNLRVNFKASKNLSLSANVARRISRPDFQQLNPNITYEDSLTYVAGNPLVKPTFMDELSISTNLYDCFTFSAGYTSYKNRRVQTAISNEENPDITIMKPINIKKAEELNLTAMYNYSSTKWEANLAIQVVNNKAKIPYLDEIKKLTDWAWYTRIGLDYTFNKHFSIYGSFWYRSKRKSIITLQHSMKSLELGLMAKFYDNRLVINLSATDLLKNTSGCNWDSRYLNISTGMRGSFDLRGVTVRVSYLFDSNKIFLKSRSGNQEILNRI